MYSFDFWWRLLRPHTLSASLIPVLLGSISAFALLHQLNIGLFLAMLTASCLIQVATNLFNEYYDYVRGLDTRESVGIGGTIVHDGASPRFVLALALTAYMIAGLLGIYICSQTTWWLLVIGGVFMLIGYLYTGGPYPISSSPFGEIFAGLSMGAGIICIAFYIQTGFILPDILLISIPTSILIGLILTANNIRDRVGDAKNGRKTLVILLGHKRAVSFLETMFFAAYAWVIWLVIFGNHSFWILLCLLSAPKAMQAVHLFRPEHQQPQEMMPAMGMVAKTNTSFGLLLALGLLLESLL